MHTDTPHALDRPIICLVRKSMRMQEDLQFMNVPCFAQKIQTTNVFYITFCQLIFV